MLRGSGGVIGGSSEVAASEMAVPGLIRHTRTRRVPIVNEKVLLSILTSCVGLNPYTYSVFFTRKEQLFSVPTSQ